MRGIEPPADREGRHATRPGFAQPRHVSLTQRHYLVTPSLNLVPVSGAVRRRHPTLGWARSHTNPKTRPALRVRGPRALLAPSPHAHFTLHFPLLVARPTFMSGLAPRGSCLRSTHWSCLGRCLQTHPWRQRPSAAFHSFPPRHPDSGGRRTFPPPSSLFLPRLVGAHTWSWVLAPSPLAFLASGVSSLASARPCMTPLRSLRCSAALARATCFGMRLILEPQRESNPRVDRLGQPAARRGLAPT